MVLKQTSIHTSFFPSSKTTTQDAPEADDVEVAGPSGGAPSVMAGEETPRNASVDAAAAEKRHDNVILVEWDGPNDPSNPLNWSKSKKAINTVLLSLMCLFIGLATAGFSSGLNDMSEELNTSLEISRVGFLVFNGAFAFVPLILGPLSEFLGSRPVYLVSMFFFVVWFVGLALSPSIAAVLVFRFLSGCSGAAGVTIIPGTLANMYEPKDRAIPVACFSLVAVLGTVAAPLYCGFIDEKLGWRWIEWVQLCSNGACFLLLVVFLRENRGSVLLTSRAKKLRKQTGDQRYRSAAELETPSLKALLHASTVKAAVMLIKEPVVLVFSLWLAYCWALIFASFSLIPIVYGEGGFGWNQGVVGLAYIGPIIGCFIAFGMSFYWSKLYDDAQRKNGGVAVPEARLYGGAFGAVIAPVGLLIVSFTSYNYLFWIGPQFGLALLLIGIYQIFESVQSFLSDAYGENSASAIAGQGFVRNALAASFPLFSSQLFNNLHVWGGGLLLSCLLIIAIPLPFILIRNGERIRASSPYAASQTGLAQQAAAANGQVITGENSDIKKASSDVESQRGLNASGPQTRVATPEPAVGAKEEEAKEGQAEVKTE